MFCFCSINLFAEQQPFRFRKSSLGWINPNKIRDSNMLAFAFKCGIITSHSYLCEGLPWPSYLPSSLIAMPGHRADTLSRGDWECNWNGLEKPWGIWFKLYSCIKYLYIYIFKSLCLYPSMQLVSHKRRNIHPLWAHRRWWWWLQLRWSWPWRVYGGLFWEGSVLGWFNSAI